VVGLEGGSDAEERNGNEDNAGEGGRAYDSNERHDDLLPSGDALTGPKGAAVANA
jgi:hypothetical protein